MSAINPQAAAAMAASAQAVADSTRSFVMDSFKGQIYISDNLDVQDTPVYDTITYVAGATITTLNSQFFTNVGSASGKSYVQTNMTTSQKLVAPEAFSIFGIRLHWSEDILRSDLTNIANGFVYEFWMGQKYYQRANIYHFSSGMGIAGYTTRTAESFYTNGIPSRDSMHKLALPLVIANQLQFYGQLFGNNYSLNGSGTGLTLLCELVGLYARGVQ